MRRVLWASAGSAGSTSLDATRQLFPERRAGSFVSMASLQVLPADLDLSPEPSSPTWMDEVLRSVVSFVPMKVGWDSYGARALHPGVLEPFLMLMRERVTFMRSAPVVMPTAEGGLRLSWEGAQGELDVDVHPEQPPTVLFETEMGTSWEGPLSECAYFDKWLWQSSSKF